MTTVGKITDAIEKFQEENKSSPSHKETHILADNNPSPKSSENEAALTQTLNSNSLKKKKNDVNNGNGLDKNLITILKPKTFEAEQFRMLKSHLLFPASGESPRSVLVTSAVPGEGKSFVAANLAISIAQSINEYVLLVDCDIRKPTLHKIFGFDDTIGLSEYLSDSVPLPSLFLKTNINKLTILPAGTPPENPGELLSSSKMSNLLQELKSRYQDRYIIIDTPPPKLTAETNIIAKQVDGVILVVKYGQTSRKMVFDLEDMFGKDKIIGAVFNMCSFKSAHYGLHKYGDYAHYYSSH